MSYNKTLLFWGGGNEERGELFLCPRCVIDFSAPKLILGTCVIARHSSPNLLLAYLTVSDAILVKIMHLDRMLVINQFFFNFLIYFLYHILFSQISSV